MTVAGLFFGGFVFVGAYFGTNLALRRWKLKIRYDKEKQKIVIETEKMKIIPKITDHVEFLSEATQEELEEMEKPKKLKKFMSKFSKPGK